MTRSLSLTPSPLPFSPPALDHRAVADDAVLGDDDDAVADEPAGFGVFGVREAALVDEPDARADARVLVHDGVADDRALADADARPALARVLLHLLDGLVVVGARHLGVLDVRAAIYPRADPDWLAR